MYGEKMFPKDVVLQSDLKKKISEGYIDTAGKNPNPIFLIWYIFYNSVNSKNQIFFPVKEIVK